MAIKLLRFLHGLVTAVEAVILAAVLLYAGFALWDNAKVYNQVENAMGDMREIKSLFGDEPLSMFDQLRAINGDVTSWIVMDGTAIDYPVLKGRTNFTYINTDVYGDFAMLGSIFMDYRNSRDFSDLYTILLGHDMSGHRMFSDVNLYKDPDFFAANTTGTLSLPDGDHPLLTLSCMLRPASNSLMFNPQNWRNMTPERILQAVQSDVLHLNPEGMRILEAMLEAGMEVHIVALTTCTSEYTDARTILLTVMDPVSVDIEFPAGGAGDCME